MNEYNVIFMETLRKLSKISFNSSSYPDYDPDDEATDEEIEVVDEDVQEDDSEEDMELVLPSGAKVGHRSLMR